MGSSQLNGAKTHQEKEASPPSPPPSPPGGLARTASSMAGKTNPAIARQSSIYSLTLDEFQNALGEPGRNFGSMNMDEFLKNIWTAEESQAMAAAMGASDGPPPSGWQLPGNNGSNSLIQRQASLSLPRTLSRKTVEDVWNELTRGNADMASMGANEGHERQLTFGEMTLEDFLVKAGVVKEDELGSRSMEGIVLGDKTADRHGHGGGLPSFSNKDGDEEKPRGLVIPTLSLAPMPPASSGQAASLSPIVADPLKQMSPAPQQPDWLADNHFRSAYGHDRHRHIVLDPPEVEAAMNPNPSSRVAGNGALMSTVMGGLGMLGAGLAGTDFGVGLGAPAMSPSLALKTASPPSPLSDGIGPSHGAMSAFSPLSYGLDGTVRSGRKRGFEGSLEKVVERRQKRMIKNRESAARSRARKQAYTVELEAEVTHLKNENMRLRRREEEMAERRRQQFLEVLSSLAPHLATKTRNLRRTRTGPW